MGNSKGSGRPAFDAEARDEWESRCRIIEITAVLRMGFHLPLIAVLSVLHVRGTFSLPLWAFVPVATYSALAGYPLLYLVRRRPAYYREFILGALTLDIAVVLAVLGSFGAPYSYLAVVPLTLVVLFGAFALKPAHAIRLGLLGGAGLLVLLVSYPQGFLWAEGRIETPGIHLIAYGLCGLVYIVTFGLLSGMLARRIQEQKAELARQKVALSEANEELHRRFDELALTNHHKNQFLFNLSHELRTPLNSILGFSELMLQGFDGPLSQAQSESVRNIRRSGRFILDFVDELLDVAKVDSGTVQLERAPVSLSELAREVFDLLGPELRRKELESRFVAEPLVEVIGDRRRLTQVLFNLISNAVKYTDEGMIRVEVAAVDGQARVRVVDSGMGIDPTEQERIFESFVRGHSQPRAGAGLGLSIARKLIELHNGRIRVESEPGKGSVFVFDLPLAGRRSAVVEDLAPANAVASVATAENPQASSKSASTNASGSNSIKSPSRSPIPA